MAKSVVDLLIGRDVAYTTDSLFTGGAGAEGELGLFNADPDSADYELGELIPTAANLSPYSVGGATQSKIVQIGVYDSALGGWRVGLPIHFDLVDSAEFVAYAASPLNNEIAQIDTITIGATDVADNTQYELTITDHSDKEQRLKIWRWFYTTGTGAVANDIRDGFIALINGTVGVPVVASSGGASTILLTGKTRAGGWPVTAYFTTSLGPAFTNATTAVTSTPVSFGQGKWFQVSDEEAAYKGYKGAMKNAWSVGTNVPATKVISGTNYDSLTITHRQLVQRQEVNSIGTPFTMTKVYAPTGANALDTSILNIMTAWLVTNGHKFPTI